MGSPFHPRCRPSRPVINGLGGSHAVCGALSFSVRQGGRRKATLKTSRQSCNDFHLQLPLYRPAVRLPYAHRLVHNPRGSFGPVQLRPYITMPCRPYRACTRACLALRHAMGGAAGLPAVLRGHHAVGQPSQPARPAPRLGLPRQVCAADSAVIESPKAANRSSRFSQAASLAQYAVRSSILLRSEACSWPGTALR